MKRKAFVLTATCAAALAVSACQKEPQQAWNGDVQSTQATAVCVDQEGKRVPDSRCGSMRQANSGGGGFSAADAFLWYYLGRSMSMPYYGEPVRGGSYTPAPNTNYARAPSTMNTTRSAAVSRGGLGSSSRTSVSSSGKSVAT